MNQPTRNSTPALPRPSQVAQGRDPYTLNAAARAHSLEQTGWPYGPLGIELLLPAYLLEFQGWNTFTWIWAASLLFLAINSHIMVQMVRAYSPQMGEKKKEK